MKLPLRTAASSVVAIVALTACGSTRFVLVDNEPRRVVPTATTQPTGATPATTATTPQPASRADLAAIRKEVGEVFSSEPKPLAARLERVIDGGDLGPTVEAVLEIVKTTGAVVAVESATVAGDKADATVTVTVGGKPFASDLPVEMIRSEGTWRVTRAGACAVLSLGSPCPDQPAP